MKMGSRAEQGRPPGQRLADCFRELEVLAAGQDKLAVVPPLVGQNL